MAPPARRIRDMKKKYRLTINRGKKHEGESIIKYKTFSGEQGFDRRALKDAVGGRLGKADEVKGTAEQLFKDRGVDSRGQLTRAARKRLARIKRLKKRSGQ